MHKSEKKVAGKANHGPGGITCPCCRPMGSKKESRQFVNRWLRRSYKEFIRQAEIELGVAIEDGGDEAYHWDYLTEMGLIACDDCGHTYEEDNWDEVHGVCPYCRNCDALLNDAFGVFKTIELDVTNNYYGVYLAAKELGIALGKIKRAGGSNMELYPLAKAFRQLVLVLHAD